ncbi:hypothetical protein LWI29_032340 [Acer saccharum]|uniref:Lachrymatory factor synthase n=1 Tax=Acer saccharum TaxID=4024 RepID=A0AA39REU8_ACESA|nr:hypothetical protein LWI29_032340 [Acer saccharum]
MEEERQPKWEGKTSVEIASLKPEQAWPCIEDFCNIHKWFPSIDACYQVEGEPGKPGLIRYCATTTQTFSSDGTGDHDDQKSTTTTTTKWAKEKLLMIDPIQRCLSYEVIDSNIGFKSYVATSKVLPIINGCGCKIEWSFVADPVEGWSQEGLASVIDHCVQFMAKKMEQEHVLLPTSGTNSEPGCIRYCAGFSIPSNDGNIHVSWSKQRLIAIDQRSLSYEIVDSNIGFESYVSTVRIVPGDHDYGGHKNGCLIEWSFAIDPMEGMEFVGLVKKYDVGLQRMAKKMEDSLLQV